MADKTTDSQKELFVVIGPVDAFSPNYRCYGVMAKNSDKTKYYNPKTGIWDVDKMQKETKRDIFVATLEERNPSKGQAVNAEGLGADKINVTLQGANTPAHLRYR